MKGLSDTLAKHIATVRFEDLPAKTVEATKISLLDAIGVSMAASTLGEGAIAFSDLARSSGGRPEATIFGFGDKVSVRDAALVNGALAHALDYEDAFDGAPLHPNAPLVAAALPIAQQRGGVSGRDFLAAMAAGCDLTCRIGLCLTTPMENFGWYPPPMFGAYGAAAAVSRILGLNPEQITDAFSLVLSQSTCSGEIKVSAKSIMRAVRDSFAAHAAVLAAQLAQRGVAGFEEPLEGKAGFFNLYAGGGYDPEILLGDLGQRFFGEGVSLKGWPSCRGTHAFIEATLDLRQKDGLTPDQIVSIHASGPRILNMLMDPIEQKRAPRTAIDAKFSLPFTIGAALINGRVTLDDFDAAALKRPEILQVAKLVGFTVIEDWGHEHMAAGRMEVTLKDGRVLTREIKHARGHPSNPIPRADLIAKFKDCARRAAKPLSEAEIDRLAETVLNLEKVSDVGAAVFEAPALATA